MFPVSLEALNDLREELEALGQAPQERRQCGHVDPLTGAVCIGAIGKKVDVTKGYPFGHEHRSEEVEGVIFTWKEDGLLGKPVGERTDTVAYSPDPHLVHSTEVTV